MEGLFVVNIYFPSCSEMQPTMVVFLLEHRRLWIVRPFLSRELAPEVWFYRAIESPELARKNCWYLATGQMSELNRRTTMPLQTLGFS
jgi:hypothetical protein